MTVEGLIPGRKYFIRTRIITETEPPSYRFNEVKMVEGTEEKTPSLDDIISGQANPNNPDPSSPLVTLLGYGFPASPAPAPILLPAQEDDDGVIINCLLGDPKNFHLFTHEEDGLLKKGSLIFGFNDSRPLADSDLKLEESVYRQFRQDLKKFNRKTAKMKTKVFGSRLKAADGPAAPTLSRPSLSPSFQEFIDHFPVLVSEEVS